MNASEKTQGKVYLIGAGPGDFELLTLKAVRIIGIADLLLVDSLVHYEVLGYAKPGARVMNVGKRGGQKSTDQSWIERLMIDAAREGLTVARVKGGDPLIFARGGEELSALHEAGIPVEVVSGVTSATGVAASLGIPLTHRDFSHQLIFVTGYSFGTPSEPLLPPLEKFNGTMVIYMGLRNADVVMDRLIACGLPPTTPVAGVQSGTTCDERFVIATAESLAHELERAQLASPVLIIVGEVIRLSPHYDKVSHRENKEKSDGVLDAEALVSTTRITVSTAAFALTTQHGESQ